jgi:four helix bundle protein
MAQGFTDLDVYKVCRRFRKQISEWVKMYFPKSEQYQLTQQILNASRSITANIAEGYGRYYYQDNIRFCRIAKGSLEETLEHLITAFDEKYITSDILAEAKAHHENCIKLLNGYIRFLLKTKNKEFD